VFGGRPEAALDNKSAERILRNPVVGRTNDDGSGSVWSAHLAARMLSLAQTGLLWGLHPHHGLSAFLHACAEHGGQARRTSARFSPGRGRQNAGKSSCDLGRRRGPPSRVFAKSGRKRKRQHLLRPMHLVTKNAREAPPFRAGRKGRGPAGATAGAIRGCGSPGLQAGEDVHSLPTQTMAPCESPMQPKEERAAVACPRGSAPASSVAGAFFPITPNAMMTRCSAADFLGWVRRIFTPCTGLKLLIFNGFLQRCLIGHDPHGNPVKQSVTPKLDP